MGSIFHWLTTGTPAHGTYLAFLVYMVIEFALGESKSVKANSVLKLVSQGLLAVPGVKVLAAKLGMGGDAASK